MAADGGFEEVQQELGWQLAEFGVEFVTEVLLKGGHNRARLFFRKLDRFHGFTTDVRRGSVTGWAPAARSSSIRGLGPWRRP